MSTASTTARARARAEITEEIKAAARRQLAEVGGAALSLRAVAREVGMVSSAVYRYFDSRDALLTALIIDAFDAVGAEAEAALAGAHGSAAGRFRTVATAVRRWAIDHPHDYALVYGSPVPGYQAPQDTVDPAARVSLAVLGILVDGVERGEIATAPTASVPRVVHADLARLRDIAAPAVPDEVLARGLVVWTGVLGAISYELFGHLHRVIEDFDAYFDHQVGRLAAFLVSGPAA